MLKGFGVAESGTSGTVKARVRMTGTGNSVRDSLANANGRIAMIIPRGTLWTRNVQLSELDVGLFIQKMFEGRLKEPVAINCGLIAFTVRRGIAAADPILIDTQKNVVLGRGGFSFRNETLDLAFRADGKQFSLFSGQSPVAIGGYFAKPSLNVISPELVGRAGVGLGLAVVVTPDRLAPRFRCCRRRQVGRLWPGPLGRYRARPARHQGAPARRYRQGHHRQVGRRQPLEGRTQGVAQEVSWHLSASSSLMSRSHGELKAGAAFFRVARSAAVHRLGAQRRAQACANV